MTEEAKKIKVKIKKVLDKDRYQHTLEVAYTAAALAMRYGCDVDTAFTAGLLHDCAKCIPGDKKYELCKKYDIELNETEKTAPYLIHAKLGAYIAEKKYGVTDAEILSSITYHTTGRPEMSVLEKIIYIADYIEPMRDKAPNLPRIRRLAFQDLDECMYEILRDTLEYLDENPKDVDDTTRRAYDFYKELHQKRHEAGEI